MNKTTQENHPVETESLPLPESRNRCTDILNDTLTGYAGIQSAEFDVKNARLAVQYDPRVISQEHALQLVRRAGQKAGVRVAECAAAGEESCARCLAEMGQDLIHHFNQVAAVTQAQTVFQENVMEIQLPAGTLPGNETARAEHPAAAGQPQPTRGVSRERAEIILTAVNLAATLAAFMLMRTAPDSGLLAVLLITAYAAGGFYGLRDGIQTLKEKQLDVNLLMILAALGAAAINQPLEGAILLFLFSLSNTLQTFAMDRSRKAIEKLLDLRPPVATVRRGSRLITLAVEQLVPGDTVLVRPGERIPIDGEVVEGSSSVDQSTITGESIPVQKEAGSQVFAGTVNGAGGLEMKATRRAEDTTLARIVKMVEEAQASKAQTQRMLDSFEQVYALFVLSGAVLLTVVPFLVLGQAFQPVFYRAMTWLVVASPCALVISTPASILSAIANGARNGILFKGGAHLEKAATLKVIAFDKTGTLTTGKPALQDLFAWDGTDPFSILRLTAAVEARSEHPIARAIVQAARDRALQLPTATDFRAVPGQGIEGNVEGQTLWIGSERLFTERRLEIPAGLLNQAHRMEASGHTVMLVYRRTDSRWLGALAVADTLRSDAAEIVAQLKQKGIEKVVMLTGDNEKVAAEIAARAGVDEYHAGLLPQDKVRLVKQLREKYGPTAMIGDGVNDAPALASADIGVAMGAAGTDVALETADVVLMADDLAKLPYVIGLSHQARRVVWQNLTFALAVIIALVVSAFGAQLPLPVGVIGHEGSTVLVVLNGLRLLVYRG